MAFRELGDRTVNNLRGINVTKNATRAVTAPGGDIGLTPAGGRLVKGSLNSTGLRRLRRSRPPA